MSSPVPPRRHRGLWLLAGFAAYIAFLAASPPSGLVSSWLHDASRGQVRLHHPAGTIWSGNGILVADIPGKESLSVPIAWTVNPLWLAAGTVQVHLTGNEADAGIDAVVRIGYRRVTLTDAHLQLPARALPLVYAPANLLAPRGQLQLRSEQIGFDRDGLHGNADLRWSGAGTGMTGATDLGEFRVEFTGQGPAAAVRLTTVRGPLVADAKGNWRALGDGELAMSGTLTLAPDAPASLAPVAALLAPGGLNLRASFPVARHLGFEPM